MKRHRKKCSGNIRIALYDCQGVGEKLQTQKGPARKRTRPINAGSKKGKGEKKSDWLGFKFWTIGDETKRNKVEKMPTKQERKGESGLLQRARLRESGAIML